MAPRIASRSSWLSNLNSSFEVRIPGRHPPSLRLATAKLTITVCLWPVLQRQPRTELRQRGTAYDTPQRNSWPLCSGVYKSVPRCSNRARPWAHAREAIPLSIYIYHGWSPAGLSPSESMKLSFIRKVLEGKVGNFSPRAEPGIRVNPEWGSVLKGGGGAKPE